MGASVNNDISAGERHRRAERRDAAAEPYDRLINKIGVSGTDPGHDRTGSTNSEGALGRQELKNANVSDATSAFGGFSGATNVQRIEANHKIDESKIRKEEAYEVFALEIARMRAREQYQGSQTA